MLRKIKLYGKLAKFVGHRILEADVATAAEAVRFLVANWPELERHMADQYYRVTVGRYDLTLDEIHDPAGQQEIRLNWPAVKPGNYRMQLSSKQFTVSKLIMRN